MNQTFPFEVIAVHRFTAAFPDEISIEEGDRLQVLASREDGWWQGFVISKGKPIKVGLFPTSYVKKTVADNSRPLVPPKPALAALRPGTAQRQEAKTIPPKPTVRFAKEAQLIEPDSPSLLTPTLPVIPEKPRRNDSEPAKVTSSPAPPVVLLPPGKPPREDSMVPEKLAYSNEPLKPLVAKRPPKPALRIVTESCNEAPTSTETSATSSSSALSSSTAAAAAAAVASTSASYLIQGASRLMELEEQMKQGISGVMVTPEEDVILGTGEFDFTLRIGEDRLGEVFKGRLAGRPVLVKRLFSGNNPNLLKAVKSLATFRHPNLLTLLSHTPLSAARPCLLYEYLPQGNLREKLDMNDPGVALPYDLRIRIAWEISGALSFLNKPHSHASPVVHQDVSSSDVYLDSHLHAKLADFSFAVTPKPSQPPGKTDVFSFGILMAELLTAKYPSKLAETIRTAMPTRSSHFPAREHLDPTMKETWSPDSYAVFAQLMRECLEVDPLDRPTMREVSDRLKRMVDHKALACVLCGSKAGNVKLSCGHLVTCHPCTTTMGRREGCPVCGAPVLESQRRMSRLVLIP